MTFVLTAARFLPSPSALSLPSLHRRQVCELLLRSLVARGAYEPADFCSRLDALLDGLDGTPYCAGDYTDVAMRDVWRGRKVGHPAGPHGCGAWLHMLEACGAACTAGCCCGPCALAGNQVRSRLPAWLSCALPLIIIPQTEGKEWGQAGLGSWCDTAEAAIRSVMLAAR